MDSKAFVQIIKSKLEPVAPIILPGIIKKQLQEVGATEDSLTPELAQQFYQFRIYPVNADIETSLLAGLYDSFVNLEGDFLDHFFNAGRMYTAVVYQPLERDSGHLAPDRIVPG